MLSKRHNTDRHTDTEATACSVPPQVLINTRMAAFALLLGAWLTPASAVTFSETAADSGIDFQRAPSADFPLVQELREQSLVEPISQSAHAPFLPMSPYGQPGIAVFDHDNDGDLDIYVTNGAGAPAALYANQLADSGVVTFVDIASSAGVGAEDMDQNGVCHGDTDNDGDADILVMGRNTPNRFFENQGNGTFVEITHSGLNVDSLSHIGCSMGDIDGDGLIDIAIANAFDLSTFGAIFIEPFAANQRNQLYLNSGNNAFIDVSERIASLDRVPPGAATITWAIAMVDIDQDGDLDIVQADDSGAIPTTKVDPVNGVDRGFIQVLFNDGTGHFVAKAQHQRPESPGAWMGLGFADFNADGHLDIFGSNFGDYNIPTVGLPLPYELGDQASRWLVSNGSGTFDDPGVGDTVSSAFGWGNAVFDYDNDGDTDMLYHGSLDVNFLVLVDNPGVVIENVGNGASYRVDDEALGHRHQRRTVHGVATGDMNRDGWVDVVSVANLRVPKVTPLVRGPVTYGSTLDPYNSFVPTYASTGVGDLMVWTGLDYLPGNLSIEQNNGKAGNGSVTLRAVGSVDITEHGRVNRDGLGAVIRFTPHRGSTAIIPILSGGTKSSSHASEAYFGLGARRAGIAEVLWPGGVRNRLYGIKNGERVVLPEIPCSFDGDESLRQYVRCVHSSLLELAEAGVIESHSIPRYFASAMIARMLR